MNDCERHGSVWFGLVRNGSVRNGTGTLFNACGFYIHKDIERDKTVILENISADGKEMSGSAGRLINPGHAIEGGWILISIENRLGKKSIG
jgi:mannose/cellobiose epimerase-like protein (N-acyl-D-glucosamine 2-epimerase family)